MKKLSDYGRDDHPEHDEERPQLAWSVALLDDCDTCEDIRVELILEEVGKPGYGMVAHLSPANARKLRSAVTTALKEIGEDKDPANG
ncbi:MAG TPA: hypothetical protein VFV02_15315 [Acidimicrobiales bacterium]|nr:hypothetical protein [Acidimicrobiales bacterium]